VQIKGIDCMYLNNYSHSNPNNTSIRSTDQLEKNINNLKSSTKEKNNLNSAQISSNSNKMDKKILVSLSNGSIY